MNTITLSCRRRKSQRPPVATRFHCPPQVSRNDNRDNPNKPLIPGKPPTACMVMGRNNDRKDSLCARIIPQTDIAQVPCSNTRERTKAISSARSSPRTRDVTTMTTPMTASFKRSKKPGQKSSRYVPETNSTGVTLYAFEAGFGIADRAKREASAGLPFDFAGPQFKYPITYTKRPIPATTIIESRETVQAFSARDRA